MAERQQPDERDVDAIFQSIVARWDDDPTTAARGTDGASTDDHVGGPATGPGDASGGAPLPPRRQSTGDVHLPSSGTERAERPTEPEPVPWRTDPTNSVADALLGGDDHLGSDGEEGFTPAPTAPLPPLSDRLFWGALAGLVLGPLCLVWLVIARPDSWWPTALVVGMILGGFACLVLRQPTDRGHDPDQGARV